MTRGTHLRNSMLAAGAIAVLGTTVAWAQASHWAFRPIRRLAANSPRSGADGWIDRLLDERIRRGGLTPTPAADARTLLRRLFLDLTGLPPTAERVDTFVREFGAGGPAGERAYLAQVDELLASPHFGEKWARHWLDLCHYADTDGYLTDQARPHAWRYRHWLVEAINRDLPFDQFTLQQLAGDLLPDVAGETSAERIDRRIATGFLRQTLSNREGGADLEEFRVEQVVDRTQLLGTVWLGLTVGCARCHDHKYDPISQKEFFALYAIFDNADEVNLDAPLPEYPEPTQAQRREVERERATILRPVAEELERLQADWERRMLDAARIPGRDHLWDREWEVLGLVWGGGQGEGQLEGCRIVELGRARRSPEQHARLQDYFLKSAAGRYPQEFKRLGLAEIRTRLERLSAGLPRPPRAATVVSSPIPRQTRLHRRGDFRSPGEVVSPGLPAALLTGPSPIGGGAPARLDLARWLVSDASPTTARVTVNRVWQELFGVGLVSTPDNFGRRGELPSHPELLDELAARFRARITQRAGGMDWSMKRLIREIVRTRAYRRSSQATPALRARDPENRLVARQAPLRLSAEAVRDSALLASGLLNAKIGGPSVYPPQPPGVSEEAYGNKWKASEGADRYRRGLYTYVQRLSPFAQNVTFDAPAGARACSRRERSNTPLQALTLLNDPVFVDCAVALGNQAQIAASDGDLGGVARLFRQALARKPEPAEVRLLTGLLQRERSRPGGSATSAWTSAAAVVLNLHEFITRD